MTKTEKKTFPIILCGGAGKRLWPLSSGSHPKQFLSLSGEYSLLQETVIRVSGIQGLEPPVLVCNEEHRILVAEAVRSLSIDPTLIILEPVGRNTAPALTLAAYALLEDGVASQEDLLIVMPSDHAIQNDEAFHSITEQGVAIAQSNYAVALGALPTYPASGFGYIEKGKELKELSPDHPEQFRNAFKIASFVEKPNEESAQKMVDGGQYLWNCGVFIISISSWLKEIAQCRPDISEVCKRSTLVAKRTGNFYRPDATIFSTCANDYIAYSIMEQSAEDPDFKAAVLPLIAGWSDVGSWSSWFEQMDRDTDGNFKQGQDIQLKSVTNSLIISEKPHVVAIGLNNIIVVESGNGLLILDNDLAESLGEVVPSEVRQEASNSESNIVAMTWGTCEVLSDTPQTKIRQLTLNPQAILSLKLKAGRTCVIVVLKGHIQLHKGLIEEDKHEGETAILQHSVQNSIENPGTVPSICLEIWSDAS